jgi:hypothetical protein
MDPLPGHDRRPGPAQVRCPACGRHTPGLLHPDETTPQARPERPNPIPAQVRCPLYGCDCYAYGLLAAGHVDLVVEADLKPYDYLPLVPVVAGAGGRMTDWQARPGRRTRPAAPPAGGGPAASCCIVGARSATRRTPCAPRSTPSIRARGAAAAAARGGRRRPRRARRAPRCRARGAAFPALASRMSRVARPSRCVSRQSTTPARSCVRQAPGAAHASLFSGSMLLHGRGRPRACSTLGGPRRAPGPAGRLTASTAAFSGDAC